MTSYPSNSHRPTVYRVGGTGLRYGRFAVCVSADPDPLLNTGQAVALYFRLITFAGVDSRNTDQGHPYRARLASSLSCSKKTVDRATDVLEKEVGLVTVEHRKVAGKPDENDANVYHLHDGWLLDNELPPLTTPPQLVARYGHTVRGFDADAWLAEHAPAFDLGAWRAAHAERLQAQEEREAEARRKERESRNPKKKTAAPAAKKAAAKKTTTRKPAETGADQQEQALAGGGDMGVPTPPDGEGSPAEGGRDTHVPTGGDMGVPTGGDMGVALLSVAGSSVATFEKDHLGDGRRPSTGGFASAGARPGAGDGVQPEGGGFAAVTEESAAEVKTDGPVPAGKPARKRAAAPAIRTREPRPVPGDTEVFERLDSLGVLTSPANRIPPLRRAVREFLGAQADARDTAFRLYPRTVEHAVTRINAGWTREHTARTAPGFVGCKRCTDTGCTGPQDRCDRIRKPQAYLAELLQAQDCDRPDCERGVILGTRETCALCVARAQAIAEDLAATTWLAEDTARQAEAQAKAKADAEQRARAAAEAEAHQAAEAEETRRIREQLAADHPELAAGAEVPGPRGGDGYAQAAGRGRAAAEEQRVRAALVAEGIVGTALDTEVRRRMTAWKADRRREAEAADLAARAARPVGAWPTVSHQQQAAAAPF